MQLTKEQTFKVFLEGSKKVCLKHKYKYNTKSRAECLNCGQDIFIGYGNVSLNSLFCERCASRKKGTLAQVKYLAYIKSQQLKFIEQANKIR